ncbi:MAG: Hsp70 family protein [Ktedonobacteraceae bacterium]|nr:Hsp70 family protein [Ktedonobacteraceae bacterium]MBV9713720.1 Hsp70 family protein [Ktedonobacteraceae bacterium]
MNDQQSTIFGIDLGTTYSCIAYVDSSGKANVLPNQEHRLTTPSVVLFEQETRIVGDEAKNSAILNSDNVVEMIKRHMGEADWRFYYDGTDYSPEEISSYILRKLAIDTEAVLGVQVKDVVITCPAYFGIAQREATARAGEIAGLHVHEIISEPTAAAIAYGLQHGRDQVVLVYDLGGGTFDIAIISIKNDATTVIATGGDHHLGGRDWDEAIVTYLAQQWKEQTGLSDDPLDAPDTLQDLWLKAETAKRALTVRDKTRVVVLHAGKTVKVEITNDKFEELTASLLDRTITFTKLTLNAACKRGYTQFSQIILVGGSTRMPQVARRLEKELHLPLRLFEPDEAAAKGAALYGQRLLLQQNIRTKAAEIQKATEQVSTMSQSAGRIVGNARSTTSVEEPVEIPTAILKQAQSAIADTLNIEDESLNKLTASSITNVASHSFGIIATIDYGTPRSRKVISNLVRTNDPLPVIQTKTYGTIEAEQNTVILEIMENTEETWIVEPEKYTSEAEIGTVTLTLPPGLPEGAPIEVTFEMNSQGRLLVTGRQPDSKRMINTVFEVKGTMRYDEKQQIISRAKDIKIL